LPLYKADLSAGSLLPAESRIVAGLLLQGGTTSTFNHSILVDNVLQKASPATARRQARLIKSRLETMPASIWQEIATGNKEVATQLMFAAALKHSALLHSFVRDVVADHARRLERTLSTHAWEPFLADCTTRDPAVAAWTDVTRRKLLQVIVRMLAEARYLESTRSLRLLPPHINPAVVRMLSALGEHSLLLTMELKA